MLGPFTIASHSAYLTSDVLRSNLAMIENGQFAEDDVLKLCAHITRCIETSKQLTDKLRELLKSKTLKARADIATLSALLDELSPSPAPKTDDSGRVLEV